MTYCYCCNKSSEELSHSGGVTQYYNGHMYCDFCYQKIKDEDEAREKKARQAPEQNEAEKRAEAEAFARELDFARKFAIDPAQVKQRIADKEAMRQKKWKEELEKNKEDVKRYYQYETVPLDDERVLIYFHTLDSAKRLVIFKDGTYQFCLKESKNQYMTVALGETNYSPAATEFDLKPMFVGLEEGDGGIKIENGKTVVVGSRTEHGSGRAKWHSHLNGDGKISKYKVTKWGCKNEDFELVFNRPLTDEEKAEKAKEDEGEQAEILKMYQTQIIPIEDQRVKYWFINTEKEENQNRYVCFEDGTAQSVYYDSDLKKYVVGWIGTWEWFDNDHCTPPQWIRIKSTYDYIVEEDIWQKYKDWGLELKFFPSEGFTLESGVSLNGYVDLKTTGFTVDEARKEFKRLRGGKGPSRSKSALSGSVKAAAQSFIGSVGLGSVSDIKSKISDAVGDVGKDAVDTLKQGLGKLFGKK